MYRQMEADDGYGQGPDWTVECIEGPIDPLWNPASRMIVTDNSGDHLLIDTLCELGEPGQVIEHSHEEGPLRVVARSWGEFLQDFADALEAGRFAYVPDEENVMPVEQAQHSDKAPESDAIHKSVDIDRTDKQGMLEASDARWRTLLAEARDSNMGRPLSPSASSGQIGQWVHIHSLDPTMQSSIGEDRWILYRDGDKRPWAIRYDDSLRSLLRVARKARDQLGLARVERWHVVAVVCDRSAVMNEWDSEMLSDVPELVLKALYLPGQVAAFDTPSGAFVVPGYRPMNAETQPSSQALHVELAAPETQSAALDPQPPTSESSEQAKVPVIAHPKDLLEVLLPIIKQGYLPHFVDIWLAEASDSDLRFQWSQYLQAYHSSRGNLKLDRISASTDLDNPCEQDLVKVFVRRINTDGFETTRPISLRYDGAFWRIASGTI